MLNYYVNFNIYERNRCQAAHKKHLVYWRQTQKKVVNTEIMQVIISVNKCSIQEDPDDMNLQCNRSLEGVKDHKYIRCHARVFPYNFFL